VNSFEKKNEASVKCCKTEILTCKTILKPLQIVILLNQLLYIIFTKLIHKPIQNCEIPNLLTDFLQFGSNL